MTETLKVMEKLFREKGGKREFQAERTYVQRHGESTLRSRK